MKFPLLLVAFIATWICAVLALLIYLDNAFAGVEGTMPMVCIVQPPGFQPHGVDPGCAPFVDPSYPAVIGVYGDWNPNHWRTFKVRPREHLSREEKCRDRFDARRILLNREPTRRLPRQCESRWLRNLKPDPYPYRG